jgi:hypothetical protein
MIVWELNSNHGTHGGLMYLSLSPNLATVNVHNFWWMLEGGKVSHCEMPEEFGDLTALETVFLIGCEIASLPATTTRLTR